MTKEELDQQLDELNISQLRGMADGKLNDANFIHGAYTDQRNHGVKKLGKATQNFFQSFSEFLEAYSGIVDIVQQAGQQYGDVAYEALSIFLIVRYLATSFSKLC